MCKGLCEEFYMLAFVAIFFFLLFMLFCCYFLDILLESSFPLIKEERKGMKA